jgi:phage head maturation protease
VTGTLRTGYNVELLTRAASFQPNTFKDNRVQVTWSTGAEVMRADWEGPFVERLSLDPASVDLSELRGGPLLDNHDRFSGVRAILGVVEDASVNGAEGVATVRFSDRHQDVANDVKEGIIRSVSAGYTVQKWETAKRADGVRIKTATRWTPKEISFTPLAADAGAKTRSQSRMNEQLQLQIRNAAVLLNLPGTWADEYIGANPEATIEQARAAAVAEMARQTPTIETRQEAATGTRDANDGIISRMADGLRARVNPLHTATEGREFAHYSIGEIAKRCLEIRGLSTVGSRAEIITRALHTTSDFSFVLAELYNKELLMLQKAPSPIQQVFKRASFTDFRARHIGEISDGAQLERVGEKGEIKYGSISDKEIASYKPASYAKAHGISFQALVNDNISALADISGKATRGARSWFDLFLVKTLIANPKLADNTAVFHANHGNLAAAGAVPSETTLAAGKLAMRSQKDISGNTLNLAPQYIVIPAALEATVDKLIAQLYPTQPADAIVSARNLTPIVEGRLDAEGQNAPWYLFANPADAPVFEYAELEGFNGPQVETRQGFETLGVEVRVVWHLGAGAIDCRGAWKNPGA